MLKLAIGGEDKVSFVEEDFVYGKSSRLTGFALFNRDGGINYVSLVIFFFVILAGVLVWRIVRLKRIK